MKHRNIKERLVDRREFVYKHRIELLMLDYQRDKKEKVEGFSMKLTGSEQKLVNLLRNEIGYSIITNDYDIFSSMIRLLKKLLKSEIYDRATRAKRVSAICAETNNM